MLPAFWQNLPAKQGETGFGAVAAAQSQPVPSARVPPPVATAQSQVGSSALGMRYGRARYGRCQRGQPGRTSHPAPPLVISQGKEICLDAAPEPVWVKGNPDLMYRAVRNLVENAIHHTPRGTVVELVVRSDGSIRVLDQGPGIDENEREFLFRRFWRHDRRQPGSAGLGLAIVRRVADAHMASITVENRDTGGASFSLRFQRAA